MVEIHTNQYSKFYNFVELLRQDQLDDFDCMIAITSRKGFGKSSTALKIGMTLHKRYLKTRFDMKDQIVFTPEEVNEKIDILPPYSCLIWDESVMGAMGEDWNKAISKILKKKITTCRTKHLIIILNIPDLSWLDGKYRNNLLTHWIHIVDRGLGVWFLPDHRPVAKDCWHLDIFDNLFPKKKRIEDPRINPEPILKKLLRHPCCEEEFVIPKVGEENYQEYLEVRDQAVYGESAPTGGVTHMEWKMRAVYCLKKYLEDLYATNSAVPQPTTTLIEKILTDPISKIKLVQRQNVPYWCSKVKQGIKNLQE
jgi:hypothetical protein